MIVEFTPTELDYINWLARQRQTNKRKNNIRNQKRDPRRSDMEAEVAGLKGEMAVAIALGLQIDDQIYLGGDPGGIDLIYDGFSIQCKYNNYYRGDLYFPSLEYFKTHFAFLVAKAGHPDRCKIHGFISRPKFEKICRHPDWNQSERPLVAVSPDKLAPVEQFHNAMQYYAPMIELTDQLFGS